MRILPILAALAALTTPAMADLRPDGSTALLGMGVVQHGAPVPFEAHDGVYYAAIEPGSFVLTFADGVPESAGVTFGPEGLFDLIDLPPETGLFGPGTAYARYEGPYATHFMTDPLCASAYYGPGFNLLDATRATDEGFPVAALETDSASRDCEAEGRLPHETDLLRTRIQTLHVVVRTDQGMERLILNFWLIHG